jgi:hypothetical protein
MAGSALTSSLTSSRGWLTPLRATLLLLGAVLGGVVLSLILGSSPAHAADGDGNSNGSATGESPLGSLTSVVSATITSTVDPSIPNIQHTVRVAGDSVATTITAGAPVVRPVVSPVVATVVSTVDSTVAATVTAVRQLGLPAVHGLLSFPNVLAAPNQALIRASTTPVIPSSAPQTASSVVSTPLNGFGSDGMSPGSILTSATGAPAAALGVLVALVALVLMAARRRLDDDALPASPIFDTDTSPA